MSKEVKVTLKLKRRYYFLILRYKIYTTLANLVPNAKLKNKLSERISNGLDKKTNKIGKYIKIES